MRPAHLHLACRDRPDSAVQIDLRPLGMAQLAGSNEEVRGKLEARASDRMAGKVIDGAEENADLNPVRDRRAVGHLGGDQSVAQRRRDVVLSRPVAMAYRNTRPQTLRSRRALS